MPLFIHLKQINTASNEISYQNSLLINCSQRHEKIIKEMVAGVKVKSKKNLAYSLLAAHTQKIDGKNVFFN